MSANYYQAQGHLSTHINILTSLEFHETLLVKYTRISRKIVTQVVVVVVVVGGTLNLDLYSFDFGNGLGADYEFG